MVELSDEDIELLEEMDRRIKKEEPPEIEERDVEEMLGEYYEEHPKKKPYLHKLKEKQQERKEIRAKERETYKKAFQKQKEKSIQQKARRRAKIRYGYTPVEKITREIKRPPQYQKKRKQQKPKKSQFDIDFGGGLGSIIQPPGKQRSSVKLPEIKFDDMLGGYGKKGKKGVKLKKIDPFEKLF